MNATTEDAAAPSGLAPGGLAPGGLAPGVRSLAIERSRLGSLVVRALPALGLALLVTANGWAGLQPGVAFWDTGEFQVIAPVLGTGHAPGFPTYVLVGFIANLLLTPIGEPAFRMNALSLLTIAAAAAFLMVTARRLGVPALVAAVAGFAMATTGVVWFQATRAEPHTMHLAFVGLLFLLLVEWGRRRRLELGEEPDGLTTGDAAGASGPGRRGVPRTADRWLIVAAVVFGLSAGNHGLTFLLAPPIVLYVLAVDPRTFLRPRLVLACAVASVGTLAAVYLELPIRAGILRAPVVYGRPDTWDGFWYVVLATQFYGLLGDPLADLPGKLRDLVDLAVAEFGVLAVLVPVGFAATIRVAPRFAVLSGSAMAITLFWNSFFQDGYIDRYYLGPVFWAWLWLAILGAFVVERVGDLLDIAPSVDRWSGARSALRPLVAAVVGVGLLLPGFADWSVKAAAADRSGDTAAARWLDEVLPAMAPNAIVVSWWSTSTPLWYAQHVEGRRTDVLVVDDRTMLDLQLGRAPDVLDACLGVRPVYALRANEGDLQELLGQFDMILVASGGSLGLYEVHARTVGQPSGPGRCPPPSS